LACILTHPHALRRQVGARCLLWSMHEAAPRAANTTAASPPADVLRAAEAEARELMEVGATHPNPNPNPNPNATTAASPPADVLRAAAEARELMEVGATLEPPRCSHAFRFRRRGPFTRRLWAVDPRF
jgi:hypothetical protein